MKLMTKTALAFCGVGAAIALSACASSAPVVSDHMVQIEVNAAYRERVALSPGHKLTVTVADVSLADAPAVELDRVDVMLDGRAPPYRVYLEVPHSQIQQNHEYAVRAEIRDPNGRLRFTTDTRHSVLTRGAPNAATIIMIGVP